MEPHCCHCSPAANGETDRPELKLVPFVCRHRRRCAEGLNCFGERHRWSTLQAPSHVGGRCVGVLGASDVRPSLRLAARAAGRRGV